MIQPLTIRGSWGDLTVDQRTGVILAYDDHGKAGWDEPDQGYGDILYILPETIAPGRDECLDKHRETDILCVGFVCSAGIVTMPMIRQLDGDDEGLLFGPALIAYHPS